MQPCYMQHNANLTGTSVPCMLALHLACPRAPCPNLCHDPCFTCLLAKGWPRPMALPSLRDLARSPACLPRMPILPCLRTRLRPCAPCPICHALQCSKSFRCPPYLFALRAPELPCLHTYSHACHVHVARALILLALCLPSLWACIAGPPGNPWFDPLQTLSAPSLPP